MLPFRIKICGVTSNEDAICACESGADAVGLNFYNKSARFVNNDAARSICDAIEEFTQQKSRNVHRIGVFVNEPVETICETAFAAGLTGVQLHGDETTDLLDELRKVMHDRLFVRAIRSRAASNLPEDIEAEINYVQNEIKCWTDAGCDAVLLDAKVSGEFGGTGHKVDWELVPKFLEGLEASTILAGGLDPWNVAEAIQTTKVKAIDVASGVESSPGTKNHDQIRRFVAEALSVLE